jgi:hypothetical protein
VKTLTAFAVFFLMLLISNPASAFVDQIAVSPLAPSANRPITISFRSGVCEGVNLPVVWELRGTGSVRDLVVNGAAFLDPLFCLNEIGTADIVIGSLSPGPYEVHIKIRDPFDGAGGIPSPSFGSVQFSVGQARPIPTMQPLSLAVLVGLLLGVVILSQRRSLPIFGVAVLTLCSVIRARGEFSARLGAHFVDIRAKVHCAAVFFTLQEPL